VITGCARRRPEVVPGVAAYITAAYWFTASTSFANPVPGVKRDDWPLEDPKGKPMETVRVIRDEIRTRVQELDEKQGWASR
jgi:hypothetical protein